MRSNHFFSLVWPKVFLPLNCFIIYIATVSFVKRIFKAQISPFTVSRIEKGMPCHMETKRKIIPALGLEVSDKDRVFFESD